MSRDLADADYYLSQGGKIPVKWTAPEVYIILYTGYAAGKAIIIGYSIYRPSYTRSTPLPVMCGALVVSCMRYGVLDTNHLKSTQMWIA